MSQVEAAAVHEVGHAFIGILLGREVTRVRLRPRPETVLKPRPLPRGRPKTGPERAALEAELMLALAGVAAEQVCEVARDAAGAMDDLAKATSLAVQLAGAARAEATVSHFLSVVRRMLDGRRERLEAVASTLVQVGVLERAELVGLLPRSSG